MKENDEVKVAVYARSAQNSEGNAVGIQIEEARKFAQSKGWNVRDADVYIDSNRPGLYKQQYSLHGLIKNLSQYDVIVTRDCARLSRDIVNFLLLTTRIKIQGIELYYYQTGMEEDERSKCMFSDILNSTIDPQCDDSQISTEVGMQS